MGMDGNVHTSSTQDKDEDQCENMNEGVVVTLAALGLAFWPLTVLLLSSEQLSVEDVSREGGEVCKRNMVSMRQRLGRREGAMPRLAC